MAEPVVFRQQVCVDPYVGGIPAFALLMPKGWAASGGIQWTPDNLMQMVWAGLAASPPEDPRVRFDLFPNRAFCAAPGLTPGTMHAGLEVREPLRPGPYLVSYVLPQIRPGASGVRIVEERPVEHPRWPAPEGFQFSAGAVVCELDVQGTPIRAELEVAIAYATQMLPALGGFQPAQLWYPLPAVATSGPPGVLERELRAMRDTFRLNPGWVRAVAAAQQRITDEMQAQQQAGFAMQQQAYRMQQQTHAMQRDVMRTMQEAADITTSGWEISQQTYDRISQDRSFATRGVDPYVDPASSVPVELPTGYEGAWSNGRGEYVLTEDSTFDPNAGYPSEDTWYRLEPARPDDA